MELIETPPNIAHNILQAGNRKIKATKGNGLFKVVSININNETFILSSKKGHQLTQNCEDYKFFICVPKNAKTVY